MKELSGTDVDTNAGAALRELCAMLFREPERLVKAHSFPILNRWRRPISPHAHHDLLQFDLALGCVGNWIVDGRQRAIQGVTLSVFYPHQVHGYEVFQGSGNARVLSVKFRIDSAWHAVRDGIFAAHYPALEHSETLVHAWERLNRLSVSTPMEPATAREPLMMARLCEILCLWPLRNAAPRAGLRHGDDLVERAMQLIERQVRRPPSLAQLADAVHLSPRHLSRRFVGATGRSPQQYADALRVSLARELLEEHLSAGEVARQLGFSGVQAFSRWFKKQSGCAPSRERQSASWRASTPSN